MQQSSIFFPHQLYKQRGDLLPSVSLKILERLAGQFISCRIRQSVQLGQDFGSESTLWQVCPLNYTAQFAVHAKQNDYVQMPPNSTQKKNPQINLSHFFLLMLVNKECSPKGEVLFNSSLDARKSHLSKFSVSLRKETDP